MLDSDDSPIEPAGQDDAIAKELADISKQISIMALQLSSLSTHFMEVEQHMPASQPSQQLPNSA
jgi:hypothetical protein